MVNCKAPIHYAAQAGSIAVVKALLEFQADVNILVKLIIFYVALLFYNTQF